MNKKGWKTAKGLIVIFFVGLVVLNALGFYFGGTFTGSVVQSVGVKDTWCVNCKKTVDNKIVELRTVSPSSVKLIVDGVEGVIWKDEVKVLNGLQIKVLETVDNPGTNDKATLLVKKVAKGIVVDDGYHEMVVSEKVSFSGGSLSVVPISPNTVLFKAGDTMKEVHKGETSRVGDVVITFLGVKNFVGNEFDKVVFYAAAKSHRLECWGCDKFNLVYGDSVNVYDKELTFMGVNDDFGKFVVDGRVDTVRLKDYTTINGLKLYVEEMKNVDTYLDRVVVSVEKEVGL